MDCREVQRDIQTFVDGEFAEEERVAIAAHLQGCPACREEEALARKLRRRVRETLRTPEAPPWLRQRVLRAVRRPPPARERTRRWLRRLAPAAVAAGVAAGLVFWHGQSAESFVAETVAWHRQDLPLDVASAAAIPDYFRDKVPVYVRPPAFHAPGVQLVGARLTSLGQQRAAYIVYRLGGQRISVFVAREDAIPRSGRVARVAGREFFLQDAAGYHVVLYRAGGRGYAVISGMRPDRLLRLVSAAE